MHPSFPALFHQLLHATGQSRSARTVELFGWLILLESPLMLLAPHFAASIIYLPALGDQAANYFRIMGLLIGGLGMLYVASGRLNSEAFVFASMLDRPLVPFIMWGLWWQEIMPGPLALAFAIQDGGSFLWTFFTWRSEQSALGNAPGTQAERTLAT
jgi:hypothetical protein